MHTSSHSQRALLLFDTNYNVCFVPCPTLRTHTSVHRCILYTWKPPSHKHIHACILMHTLKHIHTSGSTAKPMKLSKPQLRGNRTIPQCAFPTRNDSISPFGRLHIQHFLIPFCQMGPFSSTFQHRRQASLFCSIITPME